MAATAKKPEVIVEEPEAKVDTTVELEIPEGGIGGFAMSEEDFEILEAEEAKKEFGEFGLAQFTSVAKKMAGHGRYGDDSVAHIQTGEMVVPLTLLEKNPALKAQIFEQLRESGIEDPEQYVVGSKANNINPETGLMEFGFFSNLWSEVKKTFKKVVNVIKKVAPIVLPIVLAMTPLGPIYGAAMGSGIATLVNGGSVGDALKSALISGATGAAVSGFTGDAGFFENISKSAADPLARAGATWEGAKSTFSGEGLTGEGSLFADYTPTVSSEIPSSTAMDKAGDYMFRGGESAGDLSKAATGAENAYLAKMKASGIAPTEAGMKAAAAAVAPGMLATYGPSIAAGTLLAGAAGAFKTPEEEQLDLVQRNADGSVTTGSDLIAADPSRYLVHDLGSRRLNPETGEYEDVDGYTVNSPNTPMYTAPTMPTDYMPQMDMYGGEYMPGSTPGGPFRRPDPITYQAAAQGGPIYPMREGGQAPTREMGPNGYLAGSTPGGPFARRPRLTPKLPPDLPVAVPMPWERMITPAEPVKTYPKLVPHADAPRGRPMPMPAMPMPATPMPSMPTPMPSMPYEELARERPASGPVPAGNIFENGNFMPLAGSVLADYLPSFSGFADGGPIFPRRNGGVAPTEGVPGQDSVRAMLMPGEFVMTTDAVRGLGDGNLNNGIKSMYSVMRNLESRGRNTA